MIKNYDKLADTIVKGVGGIANVSAFTHCMTRLRYTLADVSKADTNMIEKTDRK